MGWTVITVTVITITYRYVTVMTNDDGNDVFGDYCKWICCIFFENVTLSTRLKMSSSHPWTVTAQFQWYCSRRLRLRCIILHVKQIECGIREDNQYAFAMSYSDNYTRGCDALSEVRQRRGWSSQQCHVKRPHSAKCWIWKITNLMCSPSTLATTSLYTEISTNCLTTPCRIGSFHWNFNYYVPRDFCSHFPFYFYITTRLPEMLTALRCMCSLLENR